MTDLYDITYGAGGLWEVHRWTSAGGLVFDLNVQDVTEGATVDQITGLHSLPEQDGARSKRPGRIGEASRRRTFGGKTVTYIGEIRGATVPLMRATRAAMLAAFGDTRPGTMDMIVHADVGGPTGRFFAELVDLEPPEVQSSNYYRRSYSLGLRLTDPRIYFPSLAVEETDSSTVTVTHTGTAPVEPVITVTGAGAAVTLTDGTHALWFSDVPSGDLIVDFAARTATVSGVPVPLLVSDSDWWDPFVEGLQPGTTSIAQTGGSGLTVAFTPAVWG